MGGDLRMCAPAEPWGQVTMQTRARPYKQLAAADFSYPLRDNTRVPCKKASHPVTSQPLLFIFYLPFHSPALTVAWQLASISVLGAQ